MYIKDNAIIPATLVPAEAGIHAFLRPCNLVSGTLCLDEKLPLYFASNRR